MNDLCINNINFMIDKKMLLENISFVVNKGDIICLLGNNGAGKSTLLKIIANILTPLSGNILLYNKNINSLTDFEKSQIISWQPQFCSKIDNFSVYSFVKLGVVIRKFLNKTYDYKDDYILNVLKLFDISSFIDQNIATLSGGEWMRVQLARVWVQNSEFMLLDEPSTGLDLFHVHTLKNNILSKAKENVGIILSTHDILLAQAVANRYIFLDKGKIIFDVLNYNDLFIALEKTYKIKFVPSNNNKIFIPQI